MLTIKCLRVLLWVVAANFSQSFSAPSLEYGNPEELETANSHENDGSHSTLPMALEDAQSEKLDYLESTEYENWTPTNKTANIPETENNLNGAKYAGSSSSSVQLPVKAEEDEADENPQTDEHITSNGEQSAENEEFEGDPIVGLLRYYEKFGLEKLLERVPDLRRVIKN